MINSICTDTVNVLRRATNPSVDVLNNPSYGDPTDWPVVYQNIKIRLAFSGKQIKISSTGELVYPTATAYIPKNYTFKPMDRIVTVKSPGIQPGIEYVVEAVYPAYILNGVVDHYEANIHLPV